PWTTVSAACPECSAFSKCMRTSRCTSIWCLLKSQTDGDTAGDTAGEGGRGERGPFPFPGISRAGHRWWISNSRCDHILQARRPQLGAERGQILGHKVGELARRIRDALAEQIVHRHLLARGREVAAVLGDVRLQRRESLIELRRIPERVLARAGEMHVEQRRLD